MSTAIAFDTLAYAKKLKAVGFTEAQAELQAEAIAELIEERLATKQDIKELEIHMGTRLKELELRLAAELAPLKWGMAIAVGGIVTLVLRSFILH